MVRKVSEEVRGDGRFGQGEQREAFAFRLGVWGILVVRWEVYALDEAVVAR